MIVPGILTDEGYVPDLTGIDPALVRSTRLLDDGTYEVELHPEQRIAALEAERNRLLSVLRDKQVIDADDEAQVRGETRDEPDRTR